MAYTRVQLRDFVRQRLGWPAADTFVVDSQLNNLLNDALVELHSLLATVYRPGQWGMVIAGVVVLSGTTSTALFGDFGRLLKVTLQYNNHHVPLEPGDRTVDITSLDRTTWTPYNVRYYLSVDGVSASMLFDRPPSTDTTILVHYMKSAPVLAADSDTSWMGWDEYVILDCMIKARTGEEGDTQDLIAQKAMLQERIRQQAEPLDIGRAATVQDARALEESGAVGERSWWQRWA